MVRVPERQQPKAQAHSEGFPAKDIDDKTCRKRQVLDHPESAEKLKSSLPCSHFTMQSSLTIARVGITECPKKHNH
jgi:hypothetical protein